MLYKKLYKNISVVALGTALFSLPVFTACESDVVDLEPVDKFSELTAYGTEERCELAVVGAYDAAQCGMYVDPNDFGWARGYPFGAASILQGEMRGEDMNLTAQFYDYTYSATYNLTTANNVAMWETSFEAINRYNTVYAGIEGAVAAGVITEEKGNQYKGECLFLRALTYHNLMIHYALPYNVEGNNNYGMPIYTKAVNDPSQLAEQQSIGRSTVKDTYDQILSDLNNAESMLPDIIDADKIGRASKGAAIALKTRVYLHMRDWNNVVTEAKKLEGGRFILETNPATPFVSYKDNQESIFSIPNDSQDNASVNGAMSAMMSAREGGRAMCPTSPTLYNSKFWKGDDKRRNLVLYRASDDYYFCDKYQNPQTREEYAPILRYAEVLLNYAEAKAELNEFGDEVWNATIRPLRERAGVRGDRPSSADPFLQTYYGIDDCDLLEIRRERAIELLLEGRRYDDLMRWHLGEKLNKQWYGIYVPALDTPYDLNGDGTNDVCFTKGEAGNEPGVSYIQVGGSSLYSLENDTSGRLLYSVGRNFEEKRYLRPVPQTALNINPDLGQNHYWK